MASSLLSLAFMAEKVVTGGDSSTMARRRVEDAGAETDELRCST